MQFDVENTNEFILYIIPKKLQILNIKFQKSYRFEFEIYTAYRLK
jgi:hypothetical protein